MTGSVRQMVRTDREYGVIEIQHVVSTGGPTTDSWLVVRRVLNEASQVCVKFAHVLAIFNIPQC